MRVYEEAARATLRTGWTRRPGGLMLLAAVLVIPALVLTVATRSVLVFILACIAIGTLYLIGLIAKAVELGIRSTQER